MKTSLKCHIAVARRWVGGARQTKESHSEYHFQIFWDRYQDISVKQVICCPSSNTIRMQFISKNNCSFVTGEQRSELKIGLIDSST